jgi:hypothetical protein
MLDAQSCVIFLLFSVLLTCHFADIGPRDLVTSCWLNIIDRGDPVRLDGDAPRWGRWAQAAEGRRRWASTPVVIIA